MAEIVYVRDANGNLVQTTIEDLREDRLEQLEQENKKLKEDNRFLTKISKEYMEKENIVEVAEFTELYKDDLEEENKNLRAYADNLDSENDNQAIEIEELKEEIKKLKKYYDRDKEELMESCYSLAKENEKLKSDLEECECSMHFENDEVGYRKRECKKLKLENADLMGERDGLKMAVEKLKEENQTLELWLDNKEKLNEGYRKEIDKYKKQYQHSMGEDNGKLTKGGYASFNEYGELMEEDTLQELKDIGKL